MFAADGNETFVLRAVSELNGARIASDAVDSVSDIIEAGFDVLPAFPVHDGAGPARQIHLVTIVVQNATIRVQKRTGNGRTLGRDERCRDAGAARPVKAIWRPFGRVRNPRKPIGCFRPVDVKLGQGLNHPRQCERIRKRVRSDSDPQYSPTTF